MYLQCLMRCIFFILMAFFILHSNASEFSENFDNKDLPKFVQKIVFLGLAEVVPEEGTHNSNAIKVLYVGSDEGSKRVISNVELEHRYQSAQLEFDVRFCPEFKFVKGGKLHGLGPRHPVAGGRPLYKDGWSARLMFSKNGRLHTYVYHQDKKIKYGDVRYASGFRFLPNVYYRVKMEVILNSSPEKSDGSVNVYVDDRQVITHDGLRFRASLSTDSEIQSFLFSTFHGGHTPEWAPRDRSGAYTTECAYFDNFSVREIHN